MIADDRYWKASAEYEAAYMDYKRLEAGLSKQKIQIGELLKKYSNTESNYEKSVLNDANKSYLTTQSDVDLALDRASRMAGALHRYW